MKELIIKKGDKQITLADKEDVMDALEDKSDKSHDHDSTYIKKTGGVSQHFNGNIIIPSASDATDNDATGKIPFAGHLISTTYSIEEFVTKLKSFMGGIKDKDNKWWNVISARQTNGGGSAGENQGLLLKTRLESTGDLIWNKQSTGSWGTEKTILDSSNYSNYAVKNNDSRLTNKRDPINNAITANSDLDDFKDTGFYYCQGDAEVAPTIINQPLTTGGQRSFSMIVELISSTRVVQKLTYYSTKDTYIRTCINGEWSTWNCVLNSNNYSNYANKTTVTDNLTTDSSTNALSAKQGKILNDRYKGITIFSTNVPSKPYLRLFNIESTALSSSGHLIFEIFGINNDSSYAKVRVDLRRTSSSPPSGTCTVVPLNISKQSRIYDNLYFAHYIGTDKSYVDIFFKTVQYRDCIFKVYDDQLRNGKYTMYRPIVAANAANDVETYTTVEAAGTALYNASYTNIINKSYNDIVASSFIKDDGTSSQFLKADGSVDTNTYAKSSDLTSAKITDTNTYSNINNTAQTQKSINEAINNRLAALNDLDLVKVVGSKPTPSADTMNKLYLTTESPSVEEDEYEIFITVRSGSSGNYTYAWEKVDTARVNLSNYVQTNDSRLSDARTPTSHNHDLKDLNIYADGQGGTNLIEDTQIFNTPSNVGLRDGTYQNCTYRRVDNTSGTGYLDIKFNIPAGTFKHGEKYTLSFWAKGTGDIRVFNYGNTNYIKTKPINCTSGGTNITSFSSYSDGNVTFALTSEWKRYFVTWELNPTSDSTNDASVDKMLILRTQAGAHAYWAGVMYERGEIPHDWSPSPKDIPRKNITASSTSIADLNHYKTAGFYYNNHNDESKYIIHCPNSDGTNTPYTNNHSFFLLVEDWGSISYSVKQTLTYYDDDTIYIRRYVNGNWGTWKKTLNSSNYSTYASPNNHNHDGTYIKTGTGTVTSTNIADGTIVNADIANTTITGGKLVNGTITATQLASNAVETAKIADSAVTSAKIADKTIVNGDIADNAAIAYSKLSGVASSTHNHNSDYAPVNHAATATTYGGGNASNYGHVKLSDAYTSSGGAASASVGASSKAVADAYSTLNTNKADKSSYVACTVTYTDGSTSTINFVTR